MWEAILSDGSVVSEKDTKWSDVKESVVGLRFYYQGIMFELPSNQASYSQAKTASVPLSSGPVVPQIESRWIGFSPDGEHTIRLRFFEREDKVILETE